jgi:hypothetical protein
LLLNCAGFASLHLPTPDTSVICAVCRSVVIKGEPALSERAQWWNGLTPPDIAAGIAKEKALEETIGAFLRIFVDFIHCAHSAAGLAYVAGSVVSCRRFVARLSRLSAVNRVSAAVSTVRSML